MTHTSTCDRAANAVSFISTEILSHRLIARDTWQLTVSAPELARRTVPGQFFMVRLAQCNDPLIGRALALYDVSQNAVGERDAISVVYVVKGKFTQSLSRRSPGDKVEIWGPLGNAFSTSAIDHLVLAAGGVGITPMLTLASAALGKESYGEPVAPSGYAKRVTLCYGARTAEYLAGLDQFEARGVDVRVATEDGSMGHRGRVTEVLEGLLQQSNNSVRVACCGPEPMMEGVGKVAAKYGVPCEVSLETPMACGIGICFTCVAKIRQEDGEWDYRRTCLEGPVFPADKVVW